MATLEVKRFDEPDERNALPLLMEQIVIGDAGPAKSLLARPIRTSPGFTILARSTRAASHTPPRPFHVGGFARVASTA
jgi:hypothetical protein